MNVDPELMLEIFCEETAQLQQEIEGLLLNLEHNPKQESALAYGELMRKLHTIKGNASAFDSGQSMVRLAHSMENVVTRLKAGELKGDNEFFTKLLQGADRIKDLMHLMKTATKSDPKFQSNVDSKVADLEKFFLSKK